ncbi:MAG TPA: FAD-dependent monooxygenase [Steroidobacteraceae bacterium]|jgi:2-polyprenyl-6-methoxyphenol hydroxylase-like FAD-dependent oxidoreductase|nr:FAD-dependent monooxygenase [Steroidobacteraceae bacterium]
MLHAAADTDVLIVGAGPVGLFLANECARRGLRYRIVETRPSQSIRSKALAIFPRTLEILDMAGLVGPFLEHANRVTSVAVMTRGRTLARMRFAPEQSPYPFVAMVPQNVTERLLVEQLHRAGGEVEYETTFVSAAQQNDGVSVVLDREGETIMLRASFVVGCDGAHSPVRHLLDLSFGGGAYEATFMLADIETGAEMPADELLLCPDESGPLAIFPMSATRLRVVAVMSRAEGDAPSLDLVRRILTERAPTGLEVSKLNWSSYFRIHHRQTAQLRVGRIFLAGDAAHIHSPFGGQGMNTGLQDVWNLAWKLDLAVRGHATESLLDSYTAERRPVIKAVIKTTDLLTKAMGTPSKAAQALRNTLIPAVSRWAPFQHAFVRRLSGLGIDYHRSPIVAGAGRRFFDDSLRGGHGIGSRFLLVSSDRAEPAARNATHRFAESLHEIVELRVGQRDDTVLVRPDGYVAYAGRHGREAASLASVRSLLAQQTTAR